MSTVLVAGAAGLEAAGPAVIPLTVLLQEARGHNPEILAARRAWQAAEQVPSQVSTLPDPEVTIQQLSVGSPRPFAGYQNSDFAYVGFGISQELPYPGKLKLKAEAAARDAGSTRYRYEATVRSVLVQVKEAYFQISYAQQTLDVLSHDEKLLDQIAKIAEARYRVGQGTQQDALKAQVERTKLLRDVTQFHQLFDAQQALIKKLLNRPLGSADLAVDPLTETPLVRTADELLSKVRTGNPDVTGQEEMVKRQSVAVELARQDRYPDFGIQYMWQHTGAPFHDYYMLTFSARLPIHRRRKLDPEIAEAADALEQSRREYESQVQSAYFSVQDQYIAAETSGQVLKIYREGLIPQALATYRSGLAAYEAGRQDFETLLSAFLDVLHFDQDYWKTLADHETALARMEQLTGASLR
ncbi:MAG TPA: TolC family protein [Bryobacteraceae bacterium]|nr:TolC family protein [Bryobacteraceae bacterium]